MYMIGIAGGSGSGKTTFAKRVLAEMQSLPESQVGILHQDSYYLPELPERLLSDGNFDHPDAFDWGLLDKQLAELHQGRSIEVPRYDYSANRRMEESVSMGPCRAVIFEGIYALWKPEIRKQLDLMVFLNVEADIRFIRRLHRDIQERGRTVDSVIAQYYSTVRPMHHQFVEPTRQYADLVVGEETEIAAGVLAAKVWEEVRDGQ